MNTTLKTGSTPPLHRRFDEADSLRQIRARYIANNDLIAMQVAALQKDEGFLSRRTLYYKRGLKDWHILAAVLNHMLNREAQRRKLGWTPERIKGRQALMDELSRILLPPNEFVGQDFEAQFSGHALVCLQSYGFQYRNLRLGDKAVEKFLRERMRHYDLDIPHAPMFGRPPGDWPV